MIIDPAPDMTGHALLILGVALLLAEFFIPSFGIIGLSGIAIFLYGAHIALDSHALMIAWGIAGVALIGMIATGVILYRTKNQAPTAGPEAMLGAAGEISEWSHGRGYVHVFGELWQATSSLQHHYAKGDKVTISGFEDMSLKIRPADEKI